MYSDIIVYRKYLKGGIYGNIITYVYCYGSEVLLCLRGVRGQRLGSTEYQPGGSRCLPDAEDHLPGSVPLPESLWDSRKGQTL